MSNPYAGLMREPSKREKEIIYFALSRLLDVTNVEKTNFSLKKWDKIDSLRDRFYTKED